MAPQSDFPNKIEVHDLYVGDQPIRIVQIECIRRSAEEFIADIGVAWDGNDLIVTAFSLETLKLSGPLTLTRFSVGNFKLCLCLKAPSARITFLRAIQSSLLEEPIGAGQAADPAEVVTLPRFVSKRVRKKPPHD